MKNKINFKDNILISGASGMAGSAIVKSLRTAGYGNNNVSGKLLMPSHKELDLLDSERVNNWFQKNAPSVVIHAAGKVGGILANSSQPADFLLENLKMQTNIIDAAFKSNVKRFLFLGSSCIYPKFSEQPIREESLLSSPLEPTNEWYAIAKIAGIKLCQSLRIQYGFDAICLMPTNLYGTNDNYHKNNSHVMASLIRKFHEAKIRKQDQILCWGSGLPLREFMHVDDLGDAVVFALEKWDPQAKNAPLDNRGLPLTFLNVGTGKDISIKELATLIAKEYAYSGKISWDNSKPDGTPKKQLNIERIKKLGWSPKISLTQGIKMTIKEYKKSINTL